MKDPEDVKYNNEKITRKPLVLEHKLLQLFMDHFFGSGNKLLQHFSSSLKSRQEEREKLKE